MVEAEGAWTAYLSALSGTGSAGSSRSQDPLVRGGDKRAYGLELEQPIPLFGRESARGEESDNKRVRLAAVVGNNKE